jgi:hypothetical protein
VKCKKCRSVFCSPTSLKEHSKTCSTGNTQCVCGFEGKSGAARPRHSSTCSALHKGHKFSCKFSLGSLTFDVVMHCFHMPTTSKYKLYLVVLMFVCVAAIPR